MALAGMSGVRQYSASTLAAMMRLPMTMKGRNLPNLPLVRSMRAPMMGSVMASNRRIPVTMTEANSMLRASTLLPKVAM